MAFPDEVQTLTQSAILLYAGSGRYRLNLLSFTPQSITTPVLFVSVLITTSPVLSF